MIYEKDFNNVSTFAAFYKNIIRKNGNIIFPYINVNVFSHVLNPSNVGENIDRCYIICEDAVIYKINQDIIATLSDKEKLGKTIIFPGGLDIEKGIHTEMEIYCKRAYLYLLEDSKLRKEFWIPIQTSNFKINMSPDEVDIFFSHKFLPENLKNLVR